MHKIKLIKNIVESAISDYSPLMDEKNAMLAINFHKSFPMYKSTPLVCLDNLATYLGVKSINVKDESYRFGLNAFKVLGSSFAVANYAADKLGFRYKALSFDNVTSPTFKEFFKKLTFYTATDGNHGRGLAWAANLLGAKCVVRMPFGTCEERRVNIERLGAIVTIENKNYDDCVRQVAEEAQKDENGVLFQDTALESYTKIPQWIMQGYLTMVKESVEQLEKAPSHVFIQAGVGSLAGAVVGYMMNKFPIDPPKIIVMEAHGAPCHFLSAQKGEIVNIEGKLSTIMAGLACGEPNFISWDILKNGAFAFASCPDWVTGLGMRILSSPIGNDSRIVSGESGAVGAGLVYSILKDDCYKNFKEMLKIDKNSNILLFSTEGATNTENYENIVWNGAYSKFNERTAKS